MTDWAGEANEACERANELLDELPDADRADPSEALGLAERALSINRQMVRELTKLPKPEPERAHVHRCDRHAGRVRGDPRDPDLTPLRPRS
jgi:hypothetical protein